jgi:TetR/AcrR family transcriptional repressor of nem operon
MDGDSNSGAARVPGDTAQQILDVAERMVQVRGFNAFSYADVAGKLGITKASLHYHFPSKAALGEALMRRYGERFGHALGDIDGRGTAAPERLAAYSELYADVLRDQRMCLCGMLAADYETLPAPIRAAVVRFFDDNEMWLEQVLEQGRADGSLRFEGSTKDIARMIVSGLEGAMLVVRPYGDPDRFRTTADALLATLSGVTART